MSDKWRIKWPESIMLSFSPTASGNVSAIVWIRQEFRNAILAKLAVPDRPAAQAGGVEAPRGGRDGEHLKCVTGACRRPSKPSKGPGGSVRVDAVGVGRSRRAEEPGAHGASGVEDVWAIAQKDRAVWLVWQRSIP